MLEKTHIRTIFKEERKKLDIALISKDIVKNIRSSDFYKNAEHVMLFYPLKYEINLLDLLNDNKKFYFPKVAGENLLVCPYDRSIRLEKSSLNIYEPVSAPVEAEILDLIFVPALAVDKKYYRLGYGGGYYDRFLKGCNAVTAVAIPEDFIIEELPHDIFDVAVEHVITNGKKAHV